MTNTTTTTTNLMINLDAAPKATIDRAIDRAKEARLFVKMVGERLFDVLSGPNTYRVQFAVANGQRLGCCTCLGGQRGLVCKHVIAAAPVNIAVHQMRKAAQAA